MATRLPGMTEEEVSEKIRTMYEAGEPLNSAHIQKSEGRLFRGALKHFGTWKKAVEHSEIDYVSISMAERGDWTKESIVSRIKEIEANGEDIWSANMRLNHQGIVLNATRFFGSWEETLKYCGLDAGLAYKKKPKWSEEEIKECISNIYIKSGTLKEKYYRENHSDIVSICQSKFGGWYLALKYFNFPLDEVKVQWSKELVIEEITKRNELGLSLCQTDVPNNLYLAGSRRFNSWTNALKCSGIDPVSHRKYTQWSKELMVNRLREYLSEGISPTYSTILAVDSALASSYTMYFESWDEFLKSCGVTFVDYDGRNLRIIGMEFEKLVRDILERTGRSFAYQEVQKNRMRPDFIMEDGNWADAKLSTWTAFVDGTLEKYTPHTNHLTIFYFRGDEIPTKDDVTLVNIETILNELCTEENEDLYRRYNAITTKINSLEKINNIAV